MGGSFKSKNQMNPVFISTDNKQTHAALKKEKKGHGPFKGRRVGLLCRRVEQPETRKDQRVRTEDDAGGDGD